MSSSSPLSDRSRGSVRAFTTRRRSSMRASVANYNATGARRSSSIYYTARPDLMKYIEEENPLLAMELNESKREREEEDTGTDFRALKLCLLVLTSIGQFGSIYTYMMTEPLMVKLSEVFVKDIAFHVNYVLMFSLRDAPGIFFSLPFGILVDNFGPAPCLVVGRIIQLIGQIILTYGIQSASWPITYTGTFVLGTGISTSNIANPAFISKWFNSNELGSALSINSVLGKVGGVIGVFLTVRIANQKNVVNAYWVSVIVVVVSLMAASIASTLDIFLSKKKIAKQAESTSNLIIGGSNSALPELSDAEIDPIRMILSGFNRRFWLLGIITAVSLNIPFALSGITQGTLLERNFFKSPTQLQCGLLHQGNCTAGYLVPKEGNPALDEGVDEGRNCLAIGYAPLLPSSLTINGDNSAGWEKEEYMFSELTSKDVNCADTFWSDDCTKNYCEEKYAATESTSIYLSMNLIGSVIFQVPFGIILDKFGCWTSMLGIVPILYFVAYFLLTFTSGSPLPIYILQSVGYAMGDAVVWPAVLFVVDASSLGLAYGIIGFFYCLGGCIFPLFIAVILKQSGGVFLPSAGFFFIGVSIFLFSIAVVLGILVRASRQRI